MTSTVRRLTSGGAIHVRTGVLQGIGPQGPRGATGPQGDRGETGAQGVPGPTGYVSESATEATGSGTIASNTTGALAAFSSVTYDQASVYSSSTTMGVHTGNWQGTAFIKFVKPTGNGAGTRRVEVLAGSTVVASCGQPAVVDLDTDITVPFTIRAATGLNITVRITQTQGASLSYVSRIWLSRIGAGIQGPQGPEGPTGPPGPQGPAGPVGPAGTLSPTTTFRDLGGS